VLDDVARASIMWHAPPQLGVVHPRVPERPERALERLVVPIRHDDFLVPLHQGLTTVHISGSTQELLMGTPLDDSFQAPF